MAKAKTLQDLFHDTLKDIYFRRKEDSRRRCRRWQEPQTPMNCGPRSTSTRAKPRDRLNALNRCSRFWGRPRRARPAMRSWASSRKGQEIMKEYKGTPALDAGLLAAAQAVEHYEISRYGTLKTWAGELGMDKAVKLLDATLSEEKKTDAGFDRTGRDPGQSGGGSGLRAPASPWAAARARTPSSACNHGRVDRSMRLRPDQLAALPRRRAAGFLLFHGGRCRAYAGLGFVVRDGPSVRRATDLAIFAPCDDWPTRNSASVS